jgi:hypothetical protein
VAESTLNLAFYDLANEVSSWLGYPDDILRLNQATLVGQQKQQANVLQRVLKAGLRRFYNPGPMDNGVPTDWSFLRPIATITIGAAQTGVQLPDDFGGIEGDVTIQPTIELVWWPLPVRNDGYILKQQSLFPQMVSRPLMCAVTPLKDQGVNQSQRWQLMIFPTTDQAYNLQFRYYILGECLSGARPYAYGGAGHAETLKAACLAAAERELNDMIGPMEQYFQERLVASMALDRKTKAQNLGYNGDNSDERHKGMQPFWHFSSTIKVNGQVYGG